MLNVTRNKHYILTLFKKRRSTRRHSWRYKVRPGSNDSFQFFCKVKSCLLPSHAIRMRICQVLAILFQALCFGAEISYKQQRGSAERWGKLFPAPQPNDHAEMQGDISRLCSKVVFKYRYSTLLCFFRDVAVADKPQCP